MVGTNRRINGSIIIKSGSSSNTRSAYNTHTFSQSRCYWNQGVWSFSWYDTLDLGFVLDDTDQQGVFGIGKQLMSYVQFKVTWGH